MASVTIVRPSQNWVPLHLGEVWQYRELLFFLTWRDVKLRYKQTVLGMAWAVLQPFLTMVVFSIFFGRLAGIPSDGIPYPIFAYAALVPWMFFSNGLTQASASLVSSATLIKRVYFPRLVIPLSSVGSGLIDFGIAFVVLVGMMMYYGIMVSARVAFLPVFLLLAFVTVLGMGIWLSALNIRFRDVKHAVPFLMQAWLFATPVAYPSSLLSDPWRTVYGLNPMAGVVEGFRWCLLGTPMAPASMMVLSGAAALVLLISGAYYFRQTERIFADVV